MSAMIACAPSEVNLDADVYLPEIDVDDTLDASFAAWLDLEAAEELEDEAYAAWLDEHADGLAEESMMASRIESGIKAW